MATMHLHQSSVDNYVVTKERFFGRDHKFWPILVLNCSHAVTSFIHLGWFFLLYFMVFDYSWLYLDLFFTRCLVPLLLLPCSNQFHPLGIIYFILFDCIFLLHFITFHYILTYFSLGAWCLLCSPMQQPASSTWDLHELFCCRHHLFQFIIITISSSWYSIVYKL